MITKPGPNPCSLVADIGGTNTRVALAEGADVVASTVRKYRNSDFEGLESVLRRYLDDAGGVQPSGACVAVAGPLHNGVGELTNRNWTFDTDTLVRTTNSEKVAVLNDLQAQGYALPFIAKQNIRQIIPAKAVSANATGLMIGIGTGFNAAAVIQTGAGVIVPPSEAGHANLPIRTDADLRLSRYIETAHGFPAVEDVLSGRGLERVYAWLGHEAGKEDALSSDEIMTRVSEGRDERATEAVAMFVRILGTVAGNLALIQLPFGGVFLIGGMARALAPHLLPCGFAEAFRDKGRFAGLMENFGVSVIEDDFAALTGCASHLTALH